MDIRSVVEQLQAATGPSSELDEAIATIMGWQKTAGTSSDPANVLWLAPAGDNSQKTPRYTSNLQAAFELSCQISPLQRGGCSWEQGLASARIDNGPYCQAATPELAMCIAALKLKMYKDSGELSEGSV